jgi:hypothetical protein
MTHTVIVVFATISHILSPVRLSAAPKTEPIGEGAGSLRQHPIPHGAFSGDEFILPRLVGGERAYLPGAVRLRF